MHELYLSSDSPIEIEAGAAAPPSRWMTIGHSGIARPALLLLAGEAVRLGRITVANGQRIAVRYGAAHGDLSRDGADLAVELIDDKGSVHRVGVLRVPRGEFGLAPRHACFDLSPWAGAHVDVRIACGAGDANDPRGDWVAIYDLAIGSEERMGALRAMAFRKERIANEIAHFSNVYDHGMYQGERGRTGPPAPPAECTPLQEVVASARTSQPRLEEPARSEFPFPQDLPRKPSGAYEYAHHLLGNSLQATAPDFAERLVRITERLQATADKPVRILSLCAGAARIEALFASRVGSLAEWTLLDISSDLLKSAARNFPPDQPPRLILADVNEIASFGEQYEIVMCVSALHHVVELEGVLNFIRDTLTDDGEFWSIGEAIGRSGNRLFDEDYRVANSVFRALPEQYRRNRNTGRIDTDLPNVDFSDATFEGIRSDEIEPLLLHRFEPVAVYRRNCFLWRLVDLAYSDNYDLSRQEDVLRIHSLVDQELAHFRHGGRPTELHGAFRKRTL